MNSCEFIGNLTKDPDVKATRNGKAMARFSIACDRNYKKADGTDAQITDYVNIVVWGYGAELVGNTCHKGSPVYVHGRFTTRSWDDQQGQKHYISEINADTVAPILRPQKAQGQWGGFAQQPPQSQQNIQQNQQNSPQQNQQQGGNFNPYPQRGAQDALNIPF